MKTSTQHVEFKFGFSGWHTPRWDWQKLHQAPAFRCPRCQHEVYPQNVLEIACADCGQEGNKNQFSAMEREAA